MTMHFLAGCAAIPDLLDQVITDTPRPAARLDGYRLAATIDGAVGLPVPGGAGVDGVLVGVDGPDLHRLDHVLRALGAHPVAGHVSSGAEHIAATLWLGPKADAPDWDFADWRARFADTLCAAIPDILAIQGELPADAIARRLGLMLVRSGSRLRAQLPQPASLRRPTGVDDMVVQRRRHPYTNFFSVEEYDLTIRRFDGDQGPTVTRAAFVSGDAVTVLPYDPVRDRVLLIEQFRAGPMARGDSNVWSLEAIAGRIDAGETPEQAGRREAVEEAGLTLGALLPVAHYYPSPGAKIEFLYNYLALTDLPDDAAGVFGLEGEGEDIRGHLINFDRLMDLVASGEINNGPLLLTAMWLQRERPRLRAGAQ